jgi:hypothetical protein
MADHNEEHESLAASYLRQIRNILMGWTMLLFVIPLLWFMFVTA